MCYECNNLKNNKAIEHFWFFSRTPTIEADVQSEVDHLLDSHFDRKALKKANNGRNACTKEIKI